MSSAGSCFRLLLASALLRLAADSPAPPADPDGSQSLPEARSFQPSAALSSISTSVSDVSLAARRGRTRVHADGDGEHITMSIYYSAGCYLYVHDLKRVSLALNEHILAV